MQVSFGIPYISGLLIQRTALVQRLEQAVSTTPWTLISAPFGAGKTLLVAQWAQQQHRSIAWVSFERGQTFSSDTYWMSVLQALNPQVQPSYGVASFEAVLAELSHHSETILVLDQFEHIGDPMIHQQMLYLLQQARGRVHPLIITRSTLPKTFRRNRVTTLATHIGWHELAFTRQETTQVLELHGYGRSDANVVSAVETLMEGWACGVQAAAQWLATQRHPYAGLEHVISHVHELVDAEVLAYLEPQQREVALKAAVAERWNAPLLETHFEHALVEDATKALIEAAIWLPCARDEHSWYRCLPVFRHVFQRIGKREYAHEWAELQATFEVWFRDQSRVVEHPELIEMLSEREYDVLKLIAQGASNHTIAEHLVVSINTVKKHVSNILGKLGVTNRTHAVIAAQEQGWL